MPHFDKDEVADVGVEPDVQTEDVEDADYWIGASDATSSVYEAFESSQYFEEEREGIFKGEGITAYIADVEASATSTPGVAYDIDQGADSTAMMEFAHGIVGNSRDVNRNFADEIVSALSENSKQPVTDGGRDAAMPIGGMPSYSETVEEVSEKYMGDFSM